MVVVRILIPNKPEVSNGFVVAPFIQGKSRSVEAFFERLRSRFVGDRLALTNAQIEPYALVQLLFFGVLPQNRLEHGGRCPILVLLEGLQGPLIERNGLE
jgi:hypothetical protein